MNKLSRATFGVIVVLWGFSAQAAVLNRLLNDTHDSSQFALLLENSSAISHPIVYDAGSQLFSLSASVIGSTLPGVGGAGNVSISMFLDNSGNLLWSSARTFLWLGTGGEPILSGTVTAYGYKEPDPGNPVLDEDIFDFRVEVTGGTAKSLVSNVIYIRANTEDSSFTADFARGFYVTVLKGFVYKHTVKLTLAATGVTCNSDEDGTITATFSGGTTPYSISIDGGTPRTGITTSPVQFTGVGPGTHTVTLTDAINGTATATANVDQPASLSLSLGQTPAKCNTSSDGKITASFDGGTAPYTVTLDTGVSQPATSPLEFDNVSAGPHHVVLTDAHNCSIEANIEVEKPLPLTVNVDGQDVKCYGLATGAATAVVAGRYWTLQLQLEYISGTDCGNGDRLASGQLHGNGDGCQWMHGSNQRNHHAAHHFISG